MPDALPTLTLQAAPDGAPRVLLGGSWSAARLADPTHWQPISQGLADLTTRGAVAWDLSAITRLDHTGAQLLWNAWGHQWPAQLQWQPGQRAMLERVARFSTPAVKPVKRTLWQLFLRLGELLWLLWDHLVGLLALTGQLLLDVVALLRAPRRGQ
jgi:phospholipid/cholesterol/gamma-HCH transport system permease protein